MTDRQRRAKLYRRENVLNAPAISATSGKRHAMADCGGVPKRQVCPYVTVVSYAVVMFTLSFAQRRLISQAQHFLYAPGIISKNALNDPHRIEMLKTCGASEDEILGRHQVCWFLLFVIASAAVDVCCVSQVDSYVRDEYCANSFFIQQLFSESFRCSYGNSCGQVLHDGGTLDNGGRFIVVVVNVLDADFQVSSPRHKYPDRHPDLTEISIRFCELVCLVVTLSRFIIRALDLSAC
jgi:hypothetical protein